MKLTSNFQSFYSKVLLQQVLKSARVRADKLIHLVAVLEHEEGGHGPNGELLGEIRDGINVKLGEVDLVLEFLGLGPPA
jgi:hypothetical protein